ncbi:transcription termination/antitermination protein NusG [Bosea sp. (in: a-proteobacteria)]|uniref:transcription termination/antitermination protein NusG n=1 Tax=Bosea sp. (in: a-proteobacteria) TaxID=1871050 RepID=UPI002636D38C|nr:transcriptional activator RfaH [Bosea sp. (in: a-proteobacteria)]MCO5090649.1 transcriptional activator RfaH [Bosea sp. (in: a-proteobacteria)]
MSATAVHSLAGARWYVVQTRHLSEMRAAQELANQGFEVFLPRYLRKRRHARKVSLVAAPLFPGYLFVSFDPARQRWRSINGTYGVARVIAGEDGPVPVASGIVGALRTRADAQGYIALSQRPGFVPGEAIRIRSGSFAETLGLFEGFRDQDRVAVLLELLGGKVRVVLDEDLVEKAA